MQTDYIIAGATGLVGTEVVKQLIAQGGAEIWCLGRSAPGPESANLHFVPHSFTTSVVWPGKKPTAPIAICTLGTTIKKAGSQAAFRQVDYDFVVNFAAEALALGARSLHVVTAHGASPKSGIFYNRVKGEVEQKLMALNLPALHLYRPSLLIGDRKEHRTGEKLASVVTGVLSPLFKLPGLSSVQPTPAEALAAYIIKTSRSALAGSHIHSNLQIMQG
ncbi:NAD-dependent epimerase/dehydratase family protein [Turneriella parva]|uniref:KR domain protein n=1 Tax=Turneriella parva (strain ATCC BAA-1111 / DSM 21527 / NCTC 11395 / H) TaxID=869212 RepID=I4B3J9_TURPD|nr:NAD-dependent epimerase/dehydratase family protein [Turneriella parva]AFM11856.1 KR domain protein [Turneriella parva DSM 21527]